MNAMEGTAAPSMAGEAARANDATQWVKVCRVDDIPRLGARRLQRAGMTDVAIFRVGHDRCFALLDRCPHQGGPLSQGLVHGERVACPLHGWTVALADGQVQAPDHGATPAFRLRVDGGVVHLDADELRRLDAEPAAAGGCACG